MFSLDRLSSASNQAIHFLNKRVINPLLSIDQRIYLFAVGIIACLLTIKLLNPYCKATEQSAESDPRITQSANRGDGQFIGHSNLVVSPTSVVFPASEIQAPAPSRVPDASNSQELPDTSEALVPALSSDPEGVSTQALPEVPVSENLMPIAALREEPEEELSNDDIHRIIYQGIQLKDENSKLTEEKLQSLNSIMDKFQHNREFQQVIYQNTDPNCMMIDYKNFGMPNDVGFPHLNAFSRYLILKGFGYGFKLQGLTHFIYYNKVDCVQDEIDESLITKQTLIDADRHVEALPKPDFSHLDQYERATAEKILSDLKMKYFVRNLNHWNWAVSIVWECNEETHAIMDTLVKAGVIHSWWTASTSNQISCKFSQSDIIKFCSGLREEDIRDLAKIEKEEQLKRDNHIQIPNDTLLTQPI